MTEKAKGQRGGYREGGGRPKGSKNIHSHDSVKKLAELGFDPIEKMVELYQTIQSKLDSGEVRNGSGAHSQFVATQQKIINDLTQYGYRKVPEKQEIETTNRKPIAVKLNLKKDDSDGKSKP
jgi:hypothetical protein